MTSIPSVEEIVDGLSVRARPFLTCDTQSECREDDPPLSIEDWQDKEHLARLTDAEKKKIRGLHREHGMKQTVF